MKRIEKALAAIMLIIAVAFFAGCTPDEPTPTPDPNDDDNPVVEIQLPGVATLTVDDITQTSACVYCKVVSDGNAEVTERGVCWSKEIEPNIDDHVIVEGSGLGEYHCVLANLDPHTVYYVRAYAKNSKGVSYGTEKGFWTLEDGGGNNIEYPVGAVPGVFTINDQGDSVCFAQGNLQYQASTGIWRFAEHQWDYVGGYAYGSDLFHGTVEGSSNNDVSSTYAGWVDFFNWGTSGWDCGNDDYHPSYQPWSLAGPYGPLNSDFTGDFANSDWGVYNAISNGGNQIGMWRTLTKDEWEYLLFTRTTASGIRFVKFKVNTGIGNDVCGLLILPDNWNPATYNLAHTNEINYPWYSISSVSAWAMANTLEKAGAVFLPAGGVRNDTWVYSANSDGTYWSSTRYDNSYAYGLKFDGTNLNLGSRDRGAGHCVRLVHDMDY